ncbi:MAG: proton-conducting transporter membrane subunit [Lewinella sp.]|jgi:NADH:ubiquinone oxidoreductase subunit 5 (subunit L)/multisubunit Na+/H+ antiporter MnhA subunit|uniref:proton-conducting transporter transmembrane domain-containing protein n=1 Tax=Lewinella sp. TaxID=2004506 RepID=UPI003D6B6FA1
MNLILPILLIVPLLALAIGFLFNNKDERPIFVATALGVGVNFIFLILLALLWASNGFEPVYYQGPVLYHQAATEFSIGLFLDAYSLVYLLTATFLTGVIVTFSKYYIHREKGYKRFFNNLKFFYFGLVLVLLSGNLETLFVGWEVLGVTSFFLIGFYRERYLPVKNALKVVSLYRVADIALLLGIWVCHHYFGHSINFSELDGLHNPQAHILDESFYQFMIPGVFLLAAMVKSAQFPFSFWVPRAMEGPTTSSAIFYGSLSVHIGVFLLIRTAPFWEENLLFHWLIGGVGLLTCIMATLTARVQSSIKTQIAYSSIAQIGLMFMEVALGWYGVALIHFVGNALLRSHQLLVSPSVLSYRIHDQFFHFAPPAAQGTQGLWNKIKLSIYVLSIKEFNLDRFMYRFFWNPLKVAGNAFHFLDEKKTYMLALPPFLMGLYAVYHQDLLPAGLLRFLPEAFALFGLIFILKAFVERKSARSSWVLIIVNQLYQSLSFGFNEAFDFNQVHLYLSGIFISGIIGVLVINQLRNKREAVSLHQFHGHSYEYPKLAFIFAIACLGLAGFPITPTFIGEDLLLGHIHENQFPLLILIVLNLILDGLVIFRIYARLFLGQHKKGYHEVAYRSS